MYVCTRVPGSKGFFLRGRERGEAKMRRNPTKRGLGGLIRSDRSGVGLGASGSWARGVVGSLAPRSVSGWWRRRVTKVCVGLTGEERMDEMSFGCFLIRT